MLRRKFAPAVSALEVRSLLSADAAPLFTIIPAPTGDVLFIELSNGSDSLFLSGSRFNDTLSVNINNKAYDLPAGIRQVAIDGGDGNDTIVSSVRDLGIVVHGGDGNDAIDVSAAAGLGYTDTIYGDAGTDTLVYDEFEDFAIEEPEFFEPLDTSVVGNVLWIYVRNDPISGSTNNTVTVEDGVITVDTISSILYDPELTDGIIVSLNDGNDTLTNTSDTYVLGLGGRGKDTLVTDNAIDDLYGEQGNDTVVYN